MRVLQSPSLTQVCRLAQEPHDGERAAPTSVLSHAPFPLLQSIAVLAEVLHPVLKGKHDLRVSAEKVIMATAAESEGVGLVEHFIDLVPVPLRNGTGGGESDEHDSVAQETTRLGAQDVLLLLCVVYGLGLSKMDHDHEPMLHKVLARFLDAEQSSSGQTKGQEENGDVSFVGFLVFILRSMCRMLTTGIWQGIHKRCLW